MKNFEGKVAWISGASAGIGAAIAKALHREGAHLVLSSRNEQTLQKVKADCSGKGKILIAPLDLSQPESIEKAYRLILEQFSAVDILVNNGGVSQRAFAVNTDMQTVRNIMEINFFGSVYMTELALPEMIENGRGHILVTSSVAGKIGSPMRSAYSASKHALHGYFESLSYELENSGIGVSLICPGYINTDISLNALKGDGSKHQKKDETQLNGLPPESVARKALSAMRHKKVESYIGGKEILTIYLKRYFPALHRRVVKSYFVKILRK